ncbi:MAG: ABC transporter ATP-binding protein [Micromonosporaceae bacterium]|nr:ABC transporter ATP-binding protein [Micromonosporaceae bacterium]
MHYLRPYRWHYVGMLLLGFLGTGLAIAIPLLVQRVIDGPVRHGDPAGLWILGALALAFGAVEAGMMFLRRYVSSATALSMEARLRSDLYRHLQRLPVSFHDGWQSGQLLSRATTDLSMIRRFLSFGLIFFIINIVTFVAVTGLLVHLYWPLGLTVAASTIPLAMISNRFTKRFNAMSRTMQDQQGDVATLVEESAGGIRVIKAFGRHDHMSSLFDARATALRDTAIDKARLTAGTWPRFDLISNIMLATSLVGGAVAVSVGHLTVGELVAFVTLQLMLIWPVDSLGFIIANAQEATTAADRIYEILDTQPSIIDRPGAVVLRRESVTGAIRFEGVRFAYPDSGGAPDGAGGPDGVGRRSRPIEVLRGVDLQIYPGETLAIVGATGSGKTTLASLIPRLIDPTGGRITLDGRDIRDFTLDSLRSVIGFAFEEATLFSMSVRENLTLGHPDATDDEIRQAIEIAQADFVWELPWGLSTRVGEQGLSLSGGQRQRLALARAVLGRPRILVLDDPLSALDVHTEALVEQALARVLRGTTAILVVHRPSTVALADRVALLKDGVIAAVGTHSHLLATEPHYREVLATATDGGADGTRSDPAAEQEEALA